jgi:hypothetical protein
MLLLSGVKGYNLNDRSIKHETETYLSALEQTAGTDHF